MERYDIIIIGSGINSLTTAALLSKKGKKVLILEQSNNIGGMASTIEFQPDYKCNIINDSIKWINPKLIKELNLTPDKLQLIKPDITHIALGQDNKHIKFHRDFKKTAESINTLSEKDANNWEGFTLHIKKITNFLEKLYQITPPKVPNLSINDALSMRSILNPVLKYGTKGIVDLLRLVPMMMPEMMDEWFENELLRGSLSTIGSHHSSLGPFSASTGYNFLHQHLFSNGVIHNNHFVNGGTNKFAEAIKTIAIENKAEILTNSKVKSINIKNDICEGVSLENGNMVKSNVIVSGVDPRNTFINLIGSQNLEPNLRIQLRNIKYRGTTARIHFALRDIPEIKNVPSQNMNTMFSICPNIEYLEKASDSVKYGQIAKEPSLEFSFPSIINPDFSPEGKHVMSVTVQYAPYHLRDKKWDSNTKNQLNKNVINVLNNYIPNINKLIESSSVYCPKDLENEYGLSEGNLNHGEMSLDQFLFMRPTISMSQYKTPFKNLYLCGPGTHPGGGLHGTNALNAVKEILKH